MDASCPICGHEVCGWLRYRPYGLVVCRRCWGKFINRRQAAFLIDWVLWMLAMRALAHVRGFNMPSLTVARVLALTCVVSLLFAFKDGFRGMSPGKYVLGLQVVEKSTLRPASFMASFKRNIHLSIPCIQVLTVLIAAYTMNKGPRWGDGWAGTKVIWREHAHKRPFDPRSNVCLTCSYGLTGNVSGICPECGTPIPNTGKDGITDSRGQ
ncbi:MAG TPA: RDD family protein [Phycisphaerae bacterium]|jgi:uncharacterized RDD family membrane protein YckC|nr:RDD family protein [Phycisphaerae bacterium]